MISVKGRTVLVTGGSRGVGRGIALKLAASGVTRIAVGYRTNRQAAEETARMLREIGAEVLLIKSDMTKADAIANMFLTIRSHFGFIDVFVDNAVHTVDVFRDARTQALTGQRQTTPDPQVRALLAASRESVRIMPNGGRIIVINNDPRAGTESAQPWTALNESKAGLASLCRYLACALASRDITVNRIDPAIKGASSLKSLPLSVAQPPKSPGASGLNLTRRVATPADIGNVVALLCSDEADCITGQLLTVDGGSRLGPATMPADFRGFCRATA